MTAQQNFCMTHICYNMQQKPYNDSLIMLFQFMHSFLKLQEINTLW